MSDELERRLREAGHRLPDPEPEDTLRARARLLEAAPHGRRPLRRRGPVLASAAAAVAAGAFGVGYAVASGGTKVVTRTRVVHARLNAGPGFLPAPNWYTASSQVGAMLTVTAENAPLVRTAKSVTIGPNVVSFTALFSPAATHPGYPQELLPLRLDRTRPATGIVRRLRAHIGAYAVDVAVTFVTPSPSPAVLVAAREELGRLVVPACPAAQGLGDSGVAAAKTYLLDWLPAHYGGNAADVVGATATAHLGRAMPRHGEAVADCGPAVAARSVEVDVTLPKLAKVSASLSELVYFVARTSSGWTVWERAR